MRIFILLSLSVILYSCSDKTSTPDKITNPNGNYTIQGKIYQNSVPVSNASVELQKNNQTIYETSTDTNGSYSISNVSADKFVLVASKEYSNGTSVYNPMELEVDGDLTLDPLLLPDPVILFPAENVGTARISLKWTKYSQNNFYEYKLYRHNNSGLDETTGELIHVATNNNDTSFVDTSLSRASRYFYRLYVNNNYGKLAGSNIIDTVTKTWDNEENFTAFYNVSEIAQIPGTGGTIWGVDYDGEFLWILNVKTYGGYYDTNEVKIIKFDFTNGQVVNEFTYNDEYIVPKSLAVWDSSIFVYFDDVSGAYIKKFSKNTGEIEQVYSIGYGVQDMSVFQDTLYLTYPSSFIQKISLPSFYLGSNIPVTHWWEGLLFGIAQRSDEIWLSGRFQDQMIILNNAGEHIGVVDLNGSFAHLCFMQDKLVVAKETSIYIYDITSL